MYLLQIFRFSDLGSFQAALDVAEQTREYSARANLDETCDSERS
jgi:hypothetical protein